MLDKDAFQAFVESGDLFDKATAERFRREVLERGGSRDGMDMYRAFRGADPDKNAMLVARGLVQTVEVEPAEAEEQMREMPRVDTREQARQRAERSRQEREAARKAEADAAATEQAE